MLPGQLIIILLVGSKFQTSLVFHPDGQAKVYHGTLSIDALGHYQGGWNHWVFFSVIQQKASGQMPWAARTTRLSGFSLCLTDAPPRLDPSFHLHANFALVFNHVFGPQLNHGNLNYIQRLSSSLKKIEPCKAGPSLTKYLFLFIIWAQAHILLIPSFYFSTTFLVVEEPLLGFLIFNDNNFYHRKSRAILRWILRQ